MEMYSRLHGVGYRAKT